MKTKTLPLHLRVLVIVFCHALSDSFGASVTLSTADSPFFPGRNNQGWWSDRIAQSPDNDNYFSGYLATTNTPNISRGYFTFDLSGIEGVVDAAAIDIRLAETKSPDPRETIGLYDISTSPLALNARDVVNPSIFDDLGTGRMYGSIEIAVGAPWEIILEIPLNEAAIADINAHIGGFFSIGASLLSLDQERVDEFVFGRSEGWPNHLIINVIPESTTLSLLIADTFLITATTWLVRFFRQYREKRFQRRKGF
jgi:hypothetical protein